MFRCTDECLLDWDKLAKFMVEIWTGRRFSFLKESWYSPDLLDEVLNLGNCKCMPFNAMQLACFAKSLVSINRLLELGAKPGVIKPVYLRQFICRDCKRRQIRVGNPHPNPRYFHYLKFIIKKQHVIRTNPTAFGVIYKRVDHNDTAETAAKCLNAIFSSGYTPVCDPSLQSHCVCNLFVEAILDYKLSYEISLLLIQFPHMRPSIIMGIGVDFSESTPAIARDENKPLIVASIYEESDNLFFFWSFYYAHSSWNRRIVTGECEEIDNIDRVSGLRELLIDNENNLKMIEFFALAEKERNFIVEGEEGKALLEDLKSVHTYFEPVPDLFDLCRNTVNRNLAYPYLTSLASLAVPEIIKTKLKLQ